MSEHYHAVVWIDHRQARIIHFNAAESDETVVRPHEPKVHIHHHANSIGSGHAAEDQDFLHNVAAAVAGQKAVLVTGPSNAKHELVKHLEAHDPRVAKAITGVETLDHPTDGELLDYARRFFRAADRTTPQKG